MAASTHVIRERPAIRALGLAAVLSLVGLVMLMMAGLSASSVPLVVAGLVVVGLGLALFGVAAWAPRRSSVQVVLDEDGYVVRIGDTDRSGRWADVERVTRGRDRITLQHKDGTSIRLGVTRSGVADLDALGADIARRLDADRGYGESAGPSTAR